MSSMFTPLLLVVLSPGLQPSVAELTIAEIRAEVRQVLRAERAAKNGHNRAFLVARLANLHTELRLDERLPQSPLLQKQRISIWSRLKRVRDELETDSARTERARGAVGGQPVGHGGGRAIPPDLGPLLVTMIERTICPEFWDVNGGPGTVVYYRPLRVLVVRATGDVHGGVGGVLGGLRK